MNRVHDILAVKGTTVHTIAAEASVLEAVKKMDQHGIGCLLILDEDGEICGLVAERDVLRRISHLNEDLAQLPVCQIMTEEVIVCKASDSIDTMRRLMKKECLRQVPVVDDDGQLAGILSLGDISAFLINDEECEIRYLHEYIEGRVR